MSKSPPWLSIALSNLSFFENNPEYKHEFGHDYIADRCGITRMTLNRNKKYMEEYKRVRDVLRGFKSGGKKTSTDYELTLKEKDKKIAELKADKSELKLRLNDCYQILEDHGIDPQFIYPTKMKKHKEA